jgi:DNA mismatch endonuclease, patch repair protein
MIDQLSPERRSANMRAIRGHSTTPEMAARRFLHAQGLRFRLHPSDIPGRPDLVFRRAKACVFVNGCFWHGCPHCSVGNRKVKTNSVFWNAKIARNKARDFRQREFLKAAGWEAFVIWECQVRDRKRLGALARRLKSLVAAAT